MQVDAPAFDAALDDEANEPFRNLHDVIESGIRHFRFDHPEPGDMLAGLRFFRAKCWPEGVHLPQRHRHRFGVKLARLRQKRLILKIIDREKRGRSLAGCGRDDGRIGQSEAALVKKVTRRFDDFCPDSKDGRLALRAHPQMAVLHQKLGAVLFGSDGVRIRLWHALNDLHIGDIEFVAARGALIGGTLPSTMTLIPASAS